MTHRHLPQGITTMVLARRTLVCNVVLVESQGGAAVASLRLLHWGTWCPRWTKEYNGHGDVRD